MSNASAVASPGSTPVPTTACWKPRSTCRPSSTARLKVACPEEIAYQNKWIDREQLRRADALGKTGYGQYLFKLAGEDA